ncbi:MAG: cation diffusion facilitator family transporter [Saprospiraceae bacterium]|nr:cation diffusion facilitator family transporter [Saprospiraceae bacterium]
MHTHHHGHHHHGHHHHGHHHHHHEIDNINQALILGILLNSVFVVVEVGVGWYYNSLALLSDAGHNIGDIAALLIALLAFKASEAKHSENFTYGYQKSSILAALANALILLFAVGIIIWQSIERLIHPSNEILGEVTALVAGIGILINAGTAWLFIKDKDKDINVKGAYLHMLADALVSLGVVVSGVIIIFTQWYWLDAVMSILIAVIILVSTWGLLTESWKLSIDGVPREIDLNRLKSQLLDLEKVQQVRNLHVWALSTSHNACTIQLMVAQDHTLAELKVLKHEIHHLLEHEHIKHSTIEFII